jgi:hypothetical protein
MTSNHIPVGIYVNLITDVIVPSLRQLPRGSVIPEG